MKTIPSNSDKTLEPLFNFKTKLNDFFDTLVSHYRWVAAFSIIIVLSGLGFGLLQQYYQNNARSARNEYYTALKTFKKEIEKVQKPNEPIRIKAAQIPETIQLLMQISQKYPKTRVGFEAHLKLGEIYSQSRDYELASQWYEKSISNAPNSFDQAIGYMGFAYSLENLNKQALAIENFKKALVEKSALLKAELTYSIARCYLALGDQEHAKEFYQKVLQEFSDSDYAQQARLALDRF